MTRQIDVQSDPDFFEWQTVVSRACITVLDQLHVDDCEIAIVLTDEEQLREFNQKYAGIDQATDVLSFPSGDVDPESDLKYLGDLLIAIPRAQKQADEKGHTLGDELSLLAIHGTLHLLGYDHASDSDKEHMWSLQALALKTLGIDDIAEEVSDG
jgi:probable rRNA maturation factor